MRIAIEGICEKAKISNVVLKSARESKVWPSPRREDVGLEGIEVFVLEIEFSIQCEEGVCEKERFEIGVNKNDCSDVFAKRLWHLSSGKTFPLNHAKGEALKPLVAALVSSKSVRFKIALKSSAWKRAFSEIENRDFGMEFTTLAY